MEVDLLGPDGNAFAIMGIVKRALSDLGEGDSYINDVMSEMQSSDYQNLLEVAVREVGLVIDFIGLDDYGIENPYF